MANAPDVFDLDAARTERARTRAARREGRGDTQRIRFGGQEIAVLAAEFPLDVLEPFTDVNVDLALLVRQAIDLASAEGASAQLSTLDMIVSVLAANPNLPREVLDAIRECGRRLLGEDGYNAFVGQRPTPWDVAALAKNLMDWYGVSLGESSSPSALSSAGATSKPTSEATTTSAPTVLGNGSGNLGSSESASFPV
jgi:hypothetical protein